MSLPFLRPSPPPSVCYLRSFFLSGNGRVGIVRSNSGASRLYLHKRGYASSPPSDANPTGPPTGADTKQKTAPAPSSTASVSSPPSIPPSSPTSSTTVSPSQPLEKLSYFVRRTASQNLPVYHSVKAGGTLRQTLVRRVDGDKDALRRDLLERLPAGLVKPENIKINRLNGHIVIKGHIAKEVAGVLRGLHF